MLLWLLGLLASPAGLLVAAASGLLLLPGGRVLGLLLMRCRTVCTVSASFALSLVANPSRLLQPLCVEGKSTSCLSCCNAHRIPCPVVQQAAPI